MKCMSDEGMQANKVSGPAAMSEVGDEPVSHVCRLSGGCEVRWDVRYDGM